MKQKRRTFKHSKFLHGAIDLFAVLLSFCLAIGITNLKGVHHIEFNFEVSIIGLIILLTYYVLHSSIEISKAPRLSASGAILLDLFKINTLGAIMLLATDFVIHTDSFPAFTILLFTILHFTILYFTRILTFDYLKDFRVNGYNTRNILIIGGNDSLKLIKKLYSEKKWGFRIVGIATNSPTIERLYYNKIHTYSSHANLKSIIRHNIIDEVICFDDVVSNEKIEEIASLCQVLGKTFRLKTNHRELLYKFDYTVQHFDKTRLYSIGNPSTERYSYIFKAAFEILVSTLIIFMISPFLLVIVALIAATSRGPVIFKQERVGLHGRKFYIYKFRTMVQNAESLKASLMSQNESDGPTFKIKKDPRITRIGHFLRKTNLDEVPQLFNVLRGEMSLIGPRPPIPEETLHYKTWHLKRLSVKPGLT
ncbi:MAG: exopolysaccharide biosynthesis polyprenyl glycosylphosphotransferase, partial [Bacteroidales bacterium]|nr:exopolysaccharide biosynthesis polyprenyl glycosylphosphotransferase [Bacteroidales bacterium]